MEASRTTSDQLVFFVNGRKVIEKSVDPEMTLLYYLRNKLRLTGTKLGCAEGGCGACTVMVSRYDRKQDKIIHMSVNACLAPLCSMHGMAVTTVEGIGSTKTMLHPVQERIAKSHGSQCGFCTPGIVMSMYTLLRNTPQPTRLQMESAFEGNLCRCTGYRPILDGFNTFTKEYQTECAMGENCCKNLKTQQSLEEGISSGPYLKGEFTREYDPSQEPIFPSELQLSGEYDSKSLVFQSDRVTWYRPTSLEDLVQLKAQYPQAKIVIGNTEIGIEVKFKNQHYPVLIAASHVPELNQVTHVEAGIQFGASTTLTLLEEILKDDIQNKPEYQTRIFSAIVEMLRWFAGQQIRNVAAIAGNIMTASPISDLNPLFLSAGCKLELLSKDGGKRYVNMGPDFFLGYRKTVIKPKEVLVSVLIPYTVENEYFLSYKQAHRRDDDIAIVNAGMHVLFEANSDVIKDLALSFGGMAPVTTMATKTMAQLIGRHWDESMVQDACVLLADDLPLPPGVPGGMESYRRSLTTSFFFKFYLSVALQLEKSQAVKSPVPPNYVSATPLYKRDASRGVQVFEEVAPGQLDDDVVGRPIAHLSAMQQATGEAIYCDDIPKFENELYMAMVTSQKSYARLISVDASAALRMPGVVDFVCHKDVPGSNVAGVVKDEEVFASDMVVCRGQVIGAIIAETQTQAQRAAKAVEICYEELDPIITIEQAIAAKSFFAPIRTLKHGDVSKGFEESDHVVEGEVRIGGQEHFYLETHAAIAIPRGEDEEMEIFASVQNVSDAQEGVWNTLGVPANKIVVRVKRIGGGFGGKETRFSVLLNPLAVAAHKVGRPVRCMLDREEDMISTGTRHPYLGRYKVGFTKEGRIMAVELDMYSNGGHSRDLSYSVMERAIFSCDNCYHSPNVRITGYICKTNISSNTAFRGFGGPQGMFISETYMSHIADTLGYSHEKVRELNLYKEKDLTPYNQSLELCNIRRCWNEVISTSEFHHRRAEVDLFNKQNRWKKRGIAVIPTKFGISFTALFLNQAGALILVYKDGSVLLSHAGVEMGQGLHTKMIQVASRVLKIPPSKIHISETSTASVPNTSPTAASCGSDLNGMAVMAACQTIMERLEPYIAANPKGSWEDWVRAAYFDRVSLSSTGFYKTPGIGYDWEKNSGNPFSYFTFGAAVSEVEIDCLTGDHTVLRTDIVMDVGTSLNPAIDIGQIEGAFIQGYGLFTLEEQRYSPKGVLYTQGPGMYKIPAFTDIPVEFNVHLLKGSSNPRAVYSSKAIGEPPLFLAASVFFAVRDAITAARAESGLSKFFPLDSPATAEKIRMACEDQFTKQFPSPEAGTYTPWFVYL